MTRLTRPKPPDVWNLTGSDMRVWERMYPGPYMLEAFQLYPEEARAYGLDPHAHYRYKPNMWRLLQRIKTGEVTDLKQLRSMDEVFVQPTRWYNHMHEVYDEVASTFRAEGLPVPRMKVYILNRQSKRIIVDWKYLRDARPLTIATSK